MRPITPQELSKAKKLDGHSTLHIDAEKVYATLAEAGYNRFDLENKMQGYESIVLPFEKNLLIKISNDHFHYGYDSLAAKDYELLQPVKVIQEANPRIAVFPLLRTGEISQQQIQGLFYSLRQKGLFLFDTLPTNFGLLNDGTAVIIDHGSVVPIDHIDKVWPPSTKGSTHREILLRKLNGKTIKQFMEGFDPSTIPNYEAAQNVHLSSMQLQYGESTAFSKGDLTALKERTDGNLARIIEDQKLYPHELPDLLTHAEASPKKDWTGKMTDAVRKLSTERE